MTIKYLKKSPKTSSTDDLKTREIVQNLLSELEKSREEVLNFASPNKLIFNPFFMLISLDILCKLIL